VSASDRRNGIRPAGGKARVLPDVRGMKPEAAVVELVRYCREADQAIVELSAALAALTARVVTLEAGP
jgi:hypothetical protein